MTEQALQTTQTGDEIVEKLRLAMEERRLDVMIAMSPENLAYASGAAPPSQKTVRQRLAAAIVPAEGDTEVVAIDLEHGLVRSQSRLQRITTYREFEEDPVGVVAASLVERGLGDARVGIETTYLSHAGHAKLAEAVPRAELVGADDLFEDLRLIKTASEIDAIRSIGQAAERIAAECVKLVAAGDAERDLGNLITERYFDAGGDSLSMLVVAAGERSSHPNAPPTARKMNAGEVVRLDVIGTSSHYYSDVARTAVVGEPTDEHRRIYDLLRSVHERTLESLRPGVLTSDVYAVYREAMENAGLPYYHFVGHGLGVTLHEEPFINDLQAIPLQPGMVLCIEPLTFIEGRFGLQIEDEVLITEDGCEPLTRAGDILRIGGGA